MSDFLASVVAASGERAASGKAARGEAELRSLVRGLAPARGLLSSLRVPGRRVIAEVKRASPSRGDIGAIPVPGSLAAAYERGGAAAISVLTEPSHFKGSVADLSAVRAATALPVLRKDFLVDPWQAWESRVSGADAALLIVAALPGERLREMASALAEAGLEALVEVHDDDELERALGVGAPLIGVNARDLKTLVVDLAVPERLGPRIPQGVIAVAESGIRTKADLERLERASFRAFLVGEALVAAGDPMRTLLEWLR